MNRISWKEIIVGTLAGVSVMTAPAVGQVTHSIEGMQVRVDNRGPGSLNRERGSMDSGPGSLHSGRNRRDGGDRGHRGGDGLREDGREDRRADRRMTGAKIDR